MSIAGLFNQIIAVYPKTSYNAQGREVNSTPSNVRGRFQAQRKTIFLPNNATLTVDAIAYVPADTTIDIDYRVDYAGVKYKVYGKYPVVDGLGNTHHLKLELLKWRQT